MTQPRYRQVFDALRRDIVAGKYRAGQKLPSEAALVKQFSTSRITVGRAVRDLRQLGMVERRAGSGTYVSAASRPCLSFGLLIPNLGETEIFEPICEGMAASPRAEGHILLWGGSFQDGAPMAESAWKLCRHYIERRVSGVFFAPLESAAGKDEVNRRIVAALEKARIPVVLLDRCVLPYPHRSPHDLVGIDNRRAGYLAAEHLLKLEARRIVFVARQDSAPTVDARIAGYREALQAHGVAAGHDWVQRIDPSDKETVHTVMRMIHPDGFVCANDRTAGELMHSLLSFGYRIPADVRIVGMDDVRYASLLPVPLTTIHQPCREIGETAMSAMVDRLARPNMLARDVLLETRLVVRESCGSRL